MRDSPDAENLINQAGRAARAWLFDRFFPFWAERARHPAGGFRERLMLDGTPLNDPVGRVRVQARQTYVFARGLLSGAEVGVMQPLVECGVASLLEACRRPDLLFGRMTEIGVGLSDDQPELYDNAFAVMALALAGHALNEQSIIDEAVASMDALDEILGHPAGGWRETLPCRTPRRQNPHMHMLEAALALREVGREAAAQARLQPLRALLSERFFDAGRGCLLELFEDDWRPIEDEALQRVEPGHEFEWAWLISNDGVEDLRALGAGLYAHAAALTDARGFARQAHYLDGEVADGARRTWAQTEALRAHLACGGEAGELRAASLFAALNAEFLTPQGGWVDRYDADGAVACSDMTAATGYHVVNALLPLADRAK